MSIRVRLTLWYTAVLAGILLIFGVAVYRFFESSLDREINHTLDQAALELQGSTSLERPRFSPNQSIVVPRLNTFSFPTIYVQAWSAQGTLQAASDNVAGYTLPLDPQTVSERSAYKHYRDVAIPGSEAAVYYLRVLTIPFVSEDADASDQPVGWLQIATPVQTIYSARRKLLGLLFQGSVVGVLLSGVMGVLLARRALSPIDTITRTAVQITRADDLDRRIPYPGPPDEVGRLAGAFNEMLERLERIFRAQRRFVADVSHELRTPLTTIRGNVDLLRRMGGADPASVSAIQGETDRMIRLVGDLLMLARADAGHLPIAREPVEIDVLLAQVAQQTRVLAGSRLRVELECPPSVGDEPLVVLGDADRLKQLLLNLADNAIKHMPHGGQVSLSLSRTDGLAREPASRASTPTLRPELRSKDSDRRGQTEGQAVERWVRLAVTDTGAGIPPEDLPHIFDRFYRAEKSRWRKPSADNDGPGTGVGLGLSIARWIAEAHGGRIEVQSQVGQGSAFYVWLPLAGPDAY